MTSFNTNRIKKECPYHPCKFYTIPTMTMAYSEHIALFSHYTHLSVDPNDGKTAPLHMTTTNPICQTLMQQLKDELISPPPVAVGDMQDMKLLIKYSSDLIKSSKPADYPEWLPPDKMMQQQMDEKAEKAARKLYEHLMKSYSRPIVEFRHRSRKIAEDAIKLIEKQEQKLEKPKKIFEVTYRTKSTLFRDCIAVGRRDECDVHLKHVNLDRHGKVKRDMTSNSRMTCIITYIESVDMLMFFWYGGTNKITIDHASVAQNTPIIKLISLEKLGKDKLEVKMLSGESFYVHAHAVN